jgi:steroid delta-isomerase-like uncharacterized protein
MTAATVLHRWFDEVWNQGQEQAIDEFLPHDGEILGLGETEATVRGPDEFKAFWRNMREVFPDLHIRVEDTVDAGSKGTVRVRLEGTHLGYGLGIPPTGRKISVAGMVTGEVANGKIVKGWNTWDQLGLLRQIGAPPVAEKDRFLQQDA